MKAKGFFILLLIFTTACFSWWVIQLERLNRENRQMNERLLFLQTELAQNQFIWIGTKKAGDTLLGPIRVGSQILYIEKNQWQQLIGRFPQLTIRLEKEFLKIAPTPEAVDAIHSKAKTKTWWLISESSLFFLLLCVGFVWIYRGLAHTLDLSRRQNAFLVSVTHELKTPIAANRLLLETLQRHKLNEEDFKQLLETGIRGTEQQLELVESLLLASQLEDKGYVFPSSILDLSSWLQKEFQLLEAEYMNKLSFDLYIEGNIYTNIEENSLRLSLRNLISNSFKYGGEGTIVSVHLSETYSGILLKVGDDGPGIPDTIKNKIFEKFYRGNDAIQQAVQGTGLGLFIVAETIRRLKGKVWVEDRVPRGSMFNLLIKPL